MHIFHLEILTQNTRHVDYLHTYDCFKKGSTIYWLKTHILEADSLASNVNCHLLPVFQVPRLKMRIIVPFRVVVRNK